MPTKRDWESLSDDYKIDALTEALTKAGSDMKFRDRCLVSHESARDAVEEAGNVQFPDNFTIEFLTRDEARKRLIFYMPDFKDVTPPIKHQAEELTPCTYSPWAPRSNTPAGLQKWQSGQ